MGTALAGVRLMDLVRHEDERGSFTEVFAEHWDIGIAPAQWSVVHSNPGVVRGMHLHLRHEEYVMVLQGAMSVGLHDLRPDSPTRGCWARFDLAAGEARCLTWPRGIVHGWMATEPTIHLQSVSEAYVTYGVDDNHGCRWDDPDLGIEWPMDAQALSDRAKGFGRLAELRDLIGAASSL